MKKKLRILHGRRVAEEYLKNTEAPVHKLVLSSGNRKNINEHLTALAAKRNITVIVIDSYQFAEKTKDIKSSQGVLLYTEEQSYSKEAVIEYCGKEKKRDIIIILDHIEDTNNLGSILRIAGFFGVELVIAPKDRSAAFTPAVEKIAAGALASVKYAAVNNLHHMIEWLKKKDYWIIGTSLKPESRSINNFQFPDKSVLIIGNEHKGLSRLVEKNCDFLIHIKGSGPIQSLNAAVSTAVFLNQFYNNS